MRRSHNNTKLIMENWRRYCDDALASIPESSVEILAETKIRLFESDSLIPSGEMVLSEVLEQYDKDIITTDQLIETFEREALYTQQQLSREEQEVLAELLEQEQAADPEEPKESKTGKPPGFFRKMKGKLAATAVKLLWVLPSSLARAIFKKIKSVAAALLGIMKSDRKEIIKKGPQSKLGKLLSKLMGLGGKLIKGALRYAKVALKAVGSFLAHPIVKWTIIALCVIVLVVAAFNAAVFSGGLAFAPAFAAKSLSFKGGIAVGKFAFQTAFMESLALMVSASHEGKPTLLREFEEIEVLFNAIGHILNMIPEGSELTQTVVIDTMEASLESGKVISQEAMTIVNTDAKLADAKDAIELLQQGIGQGGDLNDVPDIFLEGDCGACAILREAIASAKIVCENDAEMCAATSALVEDWELWSQSLIESETVDVMTEFKNTVGDVVTSEGSSEIYADHMKVTTTTKFQDLPFGHGAIEGTGGDITGAGGSTTKDFTDFTRE